MKGRILEAIIRLSKEPYVGVGDTLKPLKHGAGKWRFRMGDFRLVYLPRRENRVVSLIEFESRGEVYK